MADLSRLYRETRQYFRAAVLDLACGGGVLGFVVEPKGHRYVGVDVNPDAIEAARRDAENAGPHCRFILGDVLLTKLEGVFDTVTLLGNALIHFDTSVFSRILDNIEPNVHRGTYFIVDYRDVVGVLYRGQWGKRYTEKRGGRTVVSLRKGIDTERGELLIRSESDGRHNLDFSHAIWSPFIVEPLMHAKGWRLARRYPRRAWNGWLDVYERK